MPFKLAPLENVTKNFNEFKALYKCDLTEGTNFSLPIKASLDIFNTPENAPKDPLHTLRFIVLVTGNGEYTPCNPDLIQEARNEKIGIYTVGLDIGNNDEKELYDYLKDISRSINQTPSETNLLFNLRVVNTTPFETALNHTLEEALREHFNTIMNTSVADNIEISDRLFGYYKLEPNSLSVETIKSNSTVRDQTAESRIDYNPLPDRTSEVNVDISELLPNSTTTVTFAIDNTFDPMSLPVTVAEHNSPLIICSPIEHAQPMLTYIWHTNGQEKFVPLGVATYDESRLNVMSVNDSNFKEGSRRENLGFMNIINLLSSLISREG